LRRFRREQAIAVRTRTDGGERVTNRASRRSGRQTTPRPAPRRRSAVPALLVLVAVAALVLFALASVSFIGAPAITPPPS
jgi:ferric-dicitrate binding protein FerR (iron transport regulator)